MLKKLLGAGVILALLFGCSGGAQKRTVNALWYAQDKDGKSSGGTSDVNISVEKQNSGDLIIGFLESEVGGNGDMWRASGWMGTSVAAFLSKKDINQYKVEFTTKGRIDGPSAGTLMTVGVLSALLGDTILPDVTMTGTINPDGSVGPVGGIAHKLQGAKAAGKKKVLVPISQRYDTNVDTGESVDLVEEGKKLGIEVKEVATIYDAYKEITGKTIARFTGAIGDPQLASTTYDKLKLKVSEWKARLSELKNKIKTYNSNVLESFSQQVQEITDGEANVQSLVSQGEMPAAYTKIMETTLKAAIVQSALDIVMTIVTNGLAGIDSYLNATYSNTEQVKVLAERLAMEKINNFSDLVAVAEAYSNYGTALGIVEKADSGAAELKGMTNADQATEKAIEVGLYYMISKYAVEMADDAIDFGKEDKGAALPDTKKLLSWSSALRRASEANLQYFESTVIDEVAKQENASASEIKQGLATNDFDYLQAMVSTNVIEDIQKDLKDDLHKATAAFGLALNGFTTSAETIAKYYSLDVQLDKDKNITGFGREKALVSMLENAIQLAKENIAEADKAGANTSIATYHFMIGKTYREGKAEDKLSALVEFWKASLYARLSVILLGK